MAGLWIFEEAGEFVGWEEGAACTVLDGEIVDEMVEDAEVGWGVIVG